MHINTRKIDCKDKKTCHNSKKLLYEEEIMISTGGLPNNRPAKYMTYHQ